MRHIRCILIVLVIAITVHRPAMADDSLESIRHLEKVLAATADSASRQKDSLTRELAHVYALALLGKNQDASRYASDALEKSGNVWILGNAAYMLQSQYNQMLQWGITDNRAAQLAEHYFRRALTLDPNLDRNAILPQIDLQQLAREREIRQQKEKDLAVRFQQAAKEIRYLKPESFSELPPGIVSVLRNRKCGIPQPMGNSTPRNVVSGKFFEDEPRSWAVLCSMDEWSSILVFRNAADQNPHSLDSMADCTFLQGDENFIGFSRDIRTVGRDYILDHDRGYSGEKPAQITHQAIEDSFLEKASSLWYFSDGKWYELPGAD